MAQHNDEPTFIGVRVPRLHPRVTGLVVVAGFVLALVAMGSDLNLAIGAAFCVTAATDRLVDHTTRP